ncbi:DUF551 domain-containing protein [Cupriavidus necator]|uniref:DUF551 domain-containing protein n=1 Tax=Cupriavidus necator TaxID=106590 RepID=UPI00339D866B
MTEKNKERETLYSAAINCPHEIDSNRIVLHYDSKQPGHNALAQLGNRLDAALQAGGQPVAIHQCMCNDDDDAEHDQSGKYLWMDVSKEAFEALRMRSDVRSRIVYSAPATPLAESRQRVSLSDGWIPVADHLPTAEKDYLVKGIKHSGLYHDVAGLFNGKWMSQVTQDECKFEVSHWMPLPPADARASSSQKVELDVGLISRAIVDGFKEQYDLPGGYPAESHLIDCISQEIESSISRASSSRAEVEIPAAKPLPDLMLATYHEAVGWNACRDAMLSAAEAPKGDQHD